MANTRETLCAALAADVNTAMLAKYTWLSTGCTREIPAVEDILPKTKIPAESTPLVYMHEGDESYPEHDGDNGLTRVQLPITFAAVIKRNSHYTGAMITHANDLLSAMQKVVWNWQASAAIAPCVNNITIADPSTQDVGPDEAWVGLNVYLNYWVLDADP